MTKQQARLIRAFVWPRYIASDPGLIARLGRVTHWAFVFFAAPIIAAIMLASMETNAAKSAILAFVGLAITGRALRYILSAE